VGERAAGDVRVSAKEGKQASLHEARRVKNDEFYTRLEDIERELRHYGHHFKGKTVFLNCDDPYESDFFKYFAMSFNHLGLKKLIAVSYAGSPIVGNQLPLFDIAGLRKAPAPKEPYKVEITNVPDINKDGAIDLLDVVELLKGDSTTISMLKGNGDFRSQESLVLLKQSDIVVTNPPFSLFAEFVRQLEDHKKKFLILGNMNAVTYRDIWPLVRDGLIWLGVTRTGTGSMWFRVGDDAPQKTGQRVEGGIRYQTVGSSAWFTNLDHARRHAEIPLFRMYKDDPAKFPNYDNFVGIEVSRVDDIPIDYDGFMGVPITFLGKHNPDQFEIIAYSRKSHIPEDMMLHVGLDHSQPYVGGKAKYDRIFIRRAK
jgi:hypothetical protein